MKRVAGVALLLAGSSLLAMCLGFGLQAYLAFRFGSGIEMDAYVAAMTLPALFAAVIVASLGVIVIPVIVESKQKRGEEATARLASTLLNATAILLAIIVMATLVSARPLMRWILPGLAPATLSLSIGLLRWLLPSTVLSALAAVLVAFHQAEERFTATAISPVVGAAVLLATSTALTPSRGILGIAIATGLGAAAQVLWLLPVLHRRYRVVLDLSDEALKSAGRLLAPLIAGGFAFRATIVADRWVASLLPPGSLSHVEYATRIATVLNVLFASGIAVALYPKMSAEAAAADLPRLRETFFWGQRVLMLFLFPSLAIGWVLRAPLLRLVLEHGEFTAADTSAVAALVSWFMLGVVAGALGVLQGRVYYALKDTITPVLIGLAETAAYFVYLPILARSFGVLGIGMANAAYLFAALVVNGAVVLSKLRSDETVQLLASALRIGAMASAAGGSAWAMRSLLTNGVAALAAGTAAGVATYAALLFLTRPRELATLRSVLGEGTSWRVPR